MLVFYLTAMVWHYNLGKMNYFLSAWKKKTHIDYFIVSRGQKTGHDFTELSVCVHEC